MRGWHAERVGDLWRPPVPLTKVEFVYELAVFVVLSRVVPQDRRAGAIRRRAQLVWLREIQRCHILRRGCARLLLGGFEATMTLAVLALQTPTIKALAPSESVLVLAVRGHHDDPCKGTSRTFCVCLRTRATPPILTLWAYSDIRLASSSLVCKFRPAPIRLPQGQQAGGQHSSTTTIGRLFDVSNGSFTGKQQESYAIGRYGD